MKSVQFARLVVGGVTRVWLLHPGSGALTGARHGAGAGGVKLSWSWQSSCETIPWPCGTVLAHPHPAPSVSSDHHPEMASTTVTRSQSPRFANILKVCLHTFCSCTATIVIDYSISLSTARIVSLNNVFLLITSPLHGNIQAQEQDSSDVTMLWQCWYLVYDCQLCVTEVINPMMVSAR